MSELGKAAIVGFERRGINPETAARLGVYTGRRGEGAEVIPDRDGNVIVFPFIDRGATVGEKYRGPKKTFWQRPGGTKTFFNADALDDPGLSDGSLPLVITEGEIDCLSAIDCGFPLSVSVPEGAPPPPKEKKEDATERPNDDTGKFSFMWHNRERLKRVKRFIIAVDDDTNGKHLADELVRRLGASRCSFVTYPEGCKDLNDVLMKHGEDATRAVLDQAKPYPLKGVYSLADYPDLPPITTFSTGWSTVDAIFKPFAPSFTVVTGLPGSGKSTWVTNLAINMADKHGWKWAIFSPELPVVPHYRDKMRRIVAGEPVERLRREHIAAADRWINQHFVFIDHDVAGEDDADLTVEWILDRAYDALMRFGIRGFIIDPWNEIEHGRQKWETETDYINRALRLIIKFCRRHGLAVFILAHPTKDVGKDGRPRVPTLYDIAGSAAFFNKPDFGIVVHRPDANIDRTEVHMKKVRFESTGERGYCVLQFNRDNSRFELLNAAGNQGDMNL